MSFTIPSGTPPSSISRNPQRGRFSVVSGSKGDYIFLPDLYNLFEVPDVVLSELGEFKSNSFAQNLPGAKPFEDEVREFFVQFFENRTIEEPDSNLANDEKGLEDLVLNISQICNLACTYCYAEDLNIAKKKMLPETCREAIDRALSMSNGGLNSLKFLGGEPVLAFAEIKLAVEYVEDRCRELGFSFPSYVIVTNGTKLDASMVRFFGEKNFYVLVSMDGAQSIHDQLRPFLGGRGSYSKVLEAIERFQSSGCAVAVEAVYTRTHFTNGVSVNDVVSHLLSIGVREMQITLALGSWHGEGTFEEIEQVSDDFALAARRCIRSFLSNDPFLLRGIQFVIDGFVNKKKNSHVCGAGRTFMAVNYDGQAYPCYLLESSETAYGFVGKEWDAERYSKVSRMFVKNGKDYHDTCGKCWANEICQSCLGSSFLLEKKISKPPAWFCAVQKTLISAVLGEIGDALSGPDKSKFLTSLADFLKPRKFEA